MSLLYTTTIETPLGTMTACANKQGICLLDFDDDSLLVRKIQKLANSQKANLITQDISIFTDLRQQLDAYFSQTRQSFDIPLSLVGTDFQCQVWQTLLSIPYGTTCSYQQQAIAMQRPNSVRAVANANGQNKVAIVVPCHRVIGSNGQLTGYSSGLWRKKFLLSLEKGQSPMMDKSQSILFNTKITQ